MQSTDVSKIKRVDILPNSKNRVSELENWLIDKDYVFTSTTFTTKSFLLTLLESYKLGTALNKRKDRSSLNRYSYEELLFIVLYKEQVDIKLQEIHEQITLPESIQDVVISVIESYQMGCRQSNFEHNLNAELFGNNKFVKENPNKQTSPESLAPLYYFNHQISGEVYKNLNILFNIATH
jgi:hypothetical protein